MDAGNRPNVLIILADDLGLSDKGCYGAEIKTPHLDQLASDGLRMTNFHAAAACSPTRAMLLSGISTMAERLPEELNGRPGYDGYLNDSVVSLQKLLRDAGYETLMAGKWHLGLTPDRVPAARGFERKEERPLMDWQVLCIPAILRATHWPLQAPLGLLIRKYKGQYDDGPEALRRRRMRRAEEARAGHETKTWGADERGGAGPVGARKMEAYAVDGGPHGPEHRAGGVSHLARGGGSSNDTLITCSCRTTTVLRARSFEALPRDGGRRRHGDAYVARYVPRQRARQHRRARDSFAWWYGSRWASASSTAPGLLYKMFASEGGIRVPLILRYPDLVPRERRGGVDHVTGWELFGRRAVRQGGFKATYIPSQAVRGPSGGSCSTSSTTPARRTTWPRGSPRKLRDMIGLYNKYCKRNGGVITQSGDSRSRWNDKA
ncbi:arylsulfatase [Biscogniauxia mediterranea]|nr:arylsulfatase [Biscogniauxia mediterranea]